MVSAIKSHIVQTTDLRFQYPNAAQISFPDIQVRAGQALLLHGESGSGKSTFLHLLAGLRKPTVGEININGTALQQLSPAKLDRFRGQHIGIVYQQSYFIETLKILDNLLLSPFGAHKQRAVALAQQLNIHELLQRYPSELSVGQQQRASIARAVINQPLVILADEPTSALDNKNCDVVIELLLQLAKEHQAALIIATHDDRLSQKVENQVILDQITEMM